MAKEYNFSQERMSFVRRSFKTPFMKELMIFVNNREHFCCGLRLEKTVIKISYSLLLNEGFEVDSRHSAEPLR